MIHHSFSREEVRHALAMAIKRSSETTVKLGLVDEITAYAAAEAVLAAMDEVKSPSPRAPNN